MNAFPDLLVLAVLAGTYLLLRRERKKFASRLRVLQELADIQIREARMQLTREIQGRVGQDLHDDLSASLAGIVHQLELLSAQTEDTSIKSHIGSLSLQTGDVYRSVRNKSHFLYSDAAENTLEQSIRRITDFVLPDKLYRKEIDIDQETDERLNTNQRMEILKILQEAAVNILKHARQATEVFVFLYKDRDGKIIFQVGDNGRGGRGISGGIGLKSIRQRADALKGKFNINTGKGTVITIIFPENTEGSGIPVSYSVKQP